MCDAMRCVTDRLGEANGMWVGSDDGIGREGYRTRNFQKVCLPINQSTNQSINQSESIAQLVGLQLMHARMHIQRMYMNVIMYVCM